MRKSTAGIAGFFATRTREDFGEIYYSGFLLEFVTHSDFWLVLTKIAYTLHKDR